MKSISYNFEGIEAILSDEMFAAHQLIKNALRNLGYARMSGPLVIAVKSAATGIEAGTLLSVQDSGTGIAHDKLPEIFKGYTTGGTGLGLQIVRRIIELRSGYIHVESAEIGKPNYAYDTRRAKVSLAERSRDHGTSFTLHFPKLT